MVSTFASLPVNQHNEIWCTLVPASVIHHAVMYEGPFHPQALHKQRNISCLEKWVLPGVQFCWQMPGNSSQLFFPIHSPTSSCTIMEEPPDTETSLQETLGSTGKGESLKSPWPSFHVQKHSMSRPLHPTLMVGPRFRCMWLPTPALLTALS